VKVTKNSQTCGKGGSKKKSESRIWDVGAKGAQRRGNLRGQLLEQSRAEKMVGDHRGGGKGKWGSLYDDLAHYERLTETKMAMEETSRLRQYNLEVGERRWGGGNGKMAGDKPVTMIKSPRVAGLGGSRWEWEGSVKISQFQTRGELIPRHERQAGKY